MPELKPCILERKILTKVWGGRALESVLGISLPEGLSVGETWEVYDRPEESSRVQGSEVTLRDMMEASSEQLLGRGVKPAPGGYFPALIKFIDASEALSVQVHPDQEQAREDGDNAKNEAWVVLGAGENARVIRGLNPGVTEEEFAAAVRNGDVTDLLWAFKPEVDDVVVIPAGTVHALGPDVVVFEIQQNSDLTYRIYDWGRPREIHVDKALRAINVDTTSAGVDKPTATPEPIGEGASWLLRDEFFRVRKFDLSGTATLGTEGSFKILSVLKGFGTLGWRSGGEDSPLRLRSGDTVLIPACVDVIFLSPIGQLSMLWSDSGEAI